MINPRNSRLSAEIRKIVSDLLMFDLKDPRIPTIISVTRVDLTKDNSRAVIYVSTFEKNIDKKELINVLNKAKGFVRNKLGKVLTTYHTPEPIFKYDSSIEESIKMQQKIERLKNE